MENRFKLPKHERLHRQNDIDALFGEGSNFVVYPYKVFFIRVADDKPTCRMLVSVSKKRFHHAVKRNRVKRLTREAWRKKKTDLSELCKANNLSLNVALVYTATTLHSYAKVESSMMKIVSRLKIEHEKTETTAC